MTSLIKTQLANYLERFVKNFERDQLKLSITKGRFELKDLEFEEDLLTNLMELPTWMRLAKVSCNRLYVKIAWRKISSLPLQIHLDEVQVEVETCEPLRVPQPPMSMFSMPNMPEMKYRLPQKIADGMCLTMNTLRIAFSTKLMKADIQLLQLRTYTCTPEWQETDNIAKGRVKNSDLDETLIFRQLDFESMRIELGSIGSAANESRNITVVTSSDNVRLVTKRRLNDAAVLAMKVDNLLENIQVALSETEMKSAVDFARDINALVEASNAQTRILKAQHKYTAKQNSAKAMNEFMKKHIDEEHTEQTEKRPHFKDAKARYYMRHNIWESSQHLVFKAIDLMIVHDNDMPESFPEYRQHARYADASMKFHIENIRVDVYPFHLVSEAAGWMNRHHSVPGSDVWIDSLLNGYRRELSSIDARLFGEDFGYLMSTTIVAGIGNMTIYPVITARDVKTGNKPQELPFMSFQKSEFGIPESVPAIELSRTMYYYAKQVQWPVPKANMFVNMSPMRVSLDPKTIDWMTLMSLHVGLDLIKNLQALEKFMVGSPDPSSVKTLMRVEAYFPRIFFPKSFDNRSERGSGIQIQIAQMVITNTSVGQTKNVDEAMPKILETNLYAHPTYFPNMSSDYSLPDLVQHIRSFSQDPARRPSMMCIEATDMWAGAVSDELGTSVPLPFLDAFSLRMWLVPGNFDVSQQRKLVWGAAVVELDTNTVRVQVNDYILKLLGDVSEGIQRLGEVGGEHMAMLPKLGCPNLGLCMLMQQENVEISMVLQSEYGQQITAGDALNISNLAIAKETAATASDTASLSSLSLAPSEPQLAPAHHRSPAHFPVTGSPVVHTRMTVNAAAPTMSNLAHVNQGTPPGGPELPWWQQNKYYANRRYSESEVDDSEIPDTTSEFDETGYESDETGSVMAQGADNDSAWESELETIEGTPFNWAKAITTTPRRRVPLAEIQTSLLCITLKSLQQFMLISHGHMLVKMRLGQIVTSESRDVTLKELSSVPLQEPDLDVSRPEYLDTVLVRFENGAYSLHGDAPSIMTVCRGLNLQIGGESFRRLQALMSGIKQGAPVTSAQQQPSMKHSVSGAVAAPPTKVTADSFKMSAVPLIDVRLMNIECRLKDIIEVEKGEETRAPTVTNKDLRLKVSGLSIQSNQEGLITVSAVRDEEMDEDEERTVPTERLVKRQLAILNERKAKLEIRIRDLQARLGTSAHVSK